MVGNKKFVEKTFVIIAGATNYEWVWLAIFTENTFPDIPKTKRFAKVSRYTVSLVGHTRIDHQAQTAPFSCTLTILFCLLQCHLT